MHPRVQIPNTILLEIISYLCVGYFMYVYSLYAYIYSKVYVCYFMYVCSLFYYKFDVL